MRFDIVFSAMLQTLLPKEIVQRRARVQVNAR
jgi:hypothetical protein